MSRRLQVTLPYAGSDKLSSGGLPFTSAAWITPGPQQVGLSVIPAPTSFPPTETFEQLGGVVVWGYSAHDSPVRFARSDFHSHILEEVMQRSP